MSHALVLDRLFAAVVDKDTAAVRACFDPGARIWHGYDCIAHDLDSFIAMLEAVLAAVYLDAGFETARGIVLRLWADRLATIEDDPRDAKTALQEWAQAQGMQPPRYVQIARNGLRLLQRAMDAVGDEMEGRAARHLDRRPRMVRQ